MQNETDLDKFYKMYAKVFNDNNLIGRTEGDGSNHLQYEVGNHTIITVFNRYGTFQKHKIIEH